MFQGAITALVTPMQANGQLDMAALQKLLDYQLDNKIDAIVVNGTTGESPVLTQSEFKQLLEFCLEYIGNRCPVIAGTGSNDTRASIEKTQLAMELGASAALLVTPYYNRPTQEGLYQHYCAIAQAVAIPQILYNVPTRTACDLLPETVARLAQRSNIIGIKEAAGIAGRVEALRHACAQTPFDIYSGEDAQALADMREGAKGIISVTANVAPKEMVQMCAAHAQGNNELAATIDKSLQSLHQNLFIEPNPTPVKWALSEMGLIENNLRLPLLPLTAQKHDKVRAALVSNQLIN